MNNPYAPPSAPLKRTLDSRRINTRLAFYVNVLCFLYIVGSSAWSLVSIMSGPQVTEYKIKYLIEPMLMPMLFTALPYAFGLVAARWPTAGNCLRSLWVNLLGLIVLVIHFYMKWMNADNPSLYGGLSYLLPLLIIFLNFQVAVRAPLGARPLQAQSVDAS